MAKSTRIQHARFQMESTQGNSPHNHTNLAQHHRFMSQWHEGWSIQQTQSISLPLRNLRLSPITAITRSYHWQIDCHPSNYWTIHDRSRSIHRFIPEFPLLRQTNKSTLQHHRSTIFNQRVKSLRSNSPQHHQCTHDPWLQVHQIQHQRRPNRRVTLPSMAQNATRCNQYFKTALHYLSIPNLRLQSS